MGLAKMVLPNIDHAHVAARDADATVDQAEQRKQVVGTLTNSLALAAGAYTRPLFGST